jgi:flagellar M-ring protein FliF
VNQQLKQLLEKITGYWKQLESKQKRNLLFVAVFFVLTVSLLSWFALRPNYTVVMANQTPESLGEISQKLDELKIPTQLGSDSISVPEQYQYEARMKLAMAGLPKDGSPGYSVFDQSKIGMTDKEFDVRSKQALEGNIQNTIKMINGVSNVRVNIVPAKDKLFVTEQQQDAKASVVLALQPGKQLNADQISGIQHLVSHSVAGLKQENVTIVDQSGARLVDETGQVLVGGAGSQLSPQQQTQIQVEKDATTKIRNSLERLVGLGNVDVIVHADLNFDQKTWSNTVLKPVVDNGGAVISERNINEQNEGKGAAGVPGTQATDPNAPNYVAPDAGSSTSSKKDSTANYEWNKYMENGKTAPYAVKAYTVSVLVNDANLTPARKTELSQFVSTAIGRVNDGSANDSITIAGGQFQAPADPFATSSAFYTQPWFFGAMAAALVLFGGGAFVLSRRRKNAAAPTPILETPRMAEPPAIVEETENQKMKKQIEKLANQKPEDFVNLLRTWLVEE